MDAAVSDIIAAYSRQPLLEALRALQREEGLLAELSLRQLAADRQISRTRLFGIASSYGEFRFDEAAESVRPVSDPVPLPDFLKQAAAATGLRKAGALTVRFDSPPATLEEYRAAGGMRALKRAVSGIPQEHLFSEIVLGGLTWDTARWQLVERAGGRKVIVASAHAGDPVASQARVLVEKDAYAVLEGMFIASLAIGASRGFLFLDGESAGMVDSLGLAAEEMQRAANINFAVEVLAGPSSLVGSEDSVAVGSIERDRPMPHAVNPATRGVWARPTLVESAECFAAITATLAGDTPVKTRLFQVSGAVERPGIYEADMDVSVADLLAEAGATACAAALAGGLSGRFVSGKELALGISSSLARSDSPRWRTVHLLDEGTDIFESAAATAGYNSRYLCGLCIPCRIGSVRIAEMMAGTGSPQQLDQQTFRELAWAVERSGLCATGRGAAGMVLTAL